MTASVYLNKHSDKRLKSGHLWIYSNEIDTKRNPLATFTPGQIVKIYNSFGQGFGVGYINPHSLIAIRILSFNVDEVIDEAFFYNRISLALKLRERFFDKPFYRLVFSEGDFLPGLIVDRYGDDFVLQLNTAGMEQQKSIIIEIIKSLQAQSIVIRNTSSIRSQEQLSPYTECVWGSAVESALIEENGVKFKIPLMTGQKTGWFYDHRLNRLRLKNYVKDKRILDVFSYIGGWGIQAAVFGAAEVICVDSSASALKFVDENAALNQVSSKVKTQLGDAFEVLEQFIRENKKFDTIILDPPAFIKRKKDIPQGIAAYRRLNQLAMNLLNDNGILISASCSMHLSSENLLEILQKSAVKNNKFCQVIAQGHQGPDHPLHPALPEMDYLKVFFANLMASNQLVTVHGDS